jgi:hypothetical protein
MLIIHHVISYNSFSYMEHQGLTEIWHEAFVFQSEGFVSEMWITHDKP